MTVTRKGFLGRAAAVTGAFLVPIPAAVKAGPVEPMLVATNHTQIFGAKTKAMTEWWFESESNHILRVTLADYDKMGRKMLDGHYIPAKKSLYVQYPPGREPGMPRLLDIEYADAEGSRTLVPLRNTTWDDKGQYMVHLRALGYFGMMWA